MRTILTSRYLFTILRYGQILFLLIMLQGCSKNRDVPRPHRVTQILFKQEVITLNLGDAAELKVFHLPADVKAPGYEWSVADGSVARVENGMVHGLKPGETEVTATAKGLGLTARIKIRVLPVLPQSLRLQAEKTSLTVGEETQIIYEIEPQELSGPDQVEIEWSSSDETVCRVSDGKVLAVGAGLAEVTATIKGTAVKGSLTFQVDPLAVESVSLDFQQTTVTIGAGIRLLARVLPENATDRRLVWTSEDPQVALVDQGIVLGVKEGTTTIRVSTVDGQKSASCRMTVKPVQVQRILLSKTDLSLVVGQEHLLAATVLPDQAKDKSLKWNSSNTSVATVDQRGGIMARGKGTAIIWAVSAANPRVQTACQVVVLNPEDLVFIQVTASAKVTVNGYVSADLAGLIENGYSVPVRLISFEVMSHAREVVIGDYQATIISPSIQHRHTSMIRNVYRPYIRYVFEIDGKQYQRRVEI
ncbi:Ig domain-containing protein [Pedobacter nyackensis]|uniref:Ig-like domain-containing protein n=1 Tax=Pedobacter nyackensis TaxID=475255 RepID=UPI0029308AF3|nr:Ig-like domain-containing protein [Pedobacter nyackensis]